LIDPALTVGTEMLDVSGIGEAWSSPAPLTGGLAGIA
jgi:hypothetical protein